MTKQKKAILVIFGIIIFVFSVFLGLGYLGQITGGNSLIQRTEMNDKYVPEEITKYYPNYLLLFSHKIKPSQFIDC